MLVNNEGVLNISATLDNSELAQVAKDIKDNISTIKRVDVDTKSGVTSSALFTLLASIKKAKSDIVVPYLDDNSCVNINGLGDVRFIKKD